MAKRTAATGIPMMAIRPLEPFLPARLIKLFNDGDFKALALGFMNNEIGLGGEASTFNT